MGIEEVGEQGGCFASKMEMEIALDEAKEALDNARKGYIQWTTSDQRDFFPAGNSVSKLIPGVYVVVYNSNQGIFFQKIPVKTEGLVRFPETTSEIVINEIKLFWEKEQAFKDHGLIHKRGIILYGPPGGGKSCTIQWVMHDVVERGGIVVQFTNPEFYSVAMRMFREIQPDTPVVVIMEDIDSIVQHYSESDVLNILDGVNQLNKVVYLATTNYPELLGDRVINRPSRFDKRFHIGYPNEESRRIYLQHISKKSSSLDEDTIQKWVQDTEEFTVAHLKELYVAVCILGDKYEDSLETLKKMKEDVENDLKNKIGFASNGGNKVRKG